MTCACARTRCKEAPRRGRVRLPKRLARPRARQARCMVEGAVSTGSFMRVRDRSYLFIVHSSYIQVSGSTLHTTWPQAPAWRVCPRSARGSCACVCMCVSVCPRSRCVMCHIHVPHWAHVRDNVQAHSSSLSSRSTSHCASSASFAICASPVSSSRKLGSLKARSRKPNPPPSASGAA